MVLVRGGAGAGASHAAAELAAVPQTAPWPPRLVASSIVPASAAIPAAQDPPSSLLVPARRPPLPAAQVRRLSDVHTGLVHPMRAPLQEGDRPALLAAAAARRIAPTPPPPAPGRPAAMAAAELNKLLETVLAAAKKAEGGDTAEQVQSGRQGLFPCYPQLPLPRAPATLAKHGHGVQQPL